MAVIRLAPSGPVIANSGGAPLSPGSGMPMRMNQQVIPFSAGAVSDPLTGADYLLGVNPVLPGTSFPVGLLACNPAAFYDLRAEFDVQNSDAGQGQILCLLQTAPATVGPWTTRAQTTHDIGGAPVGTITTRRIISQMPPTLGSALGVAALTPDLYFRVVLQAPTGAALRVASYSGTQGTTIVQLTERF